MLDHRKKSSFLSLSNLPFFLIPFGKIVRKIVLSANIRINPYAFEADGMGTNHNVVFLDQADFRAAYARAVASAPFDYKIPWRVHQALWCTRYAMSLDVEAVFVELGTGRGFIMSAVLESISPPGHALRTPDVYLFDTFLPFNTDGIAKQSEALGTNIHYATDVEATKFNFNEWNFVNIVQGSLPQTLEKITGQKISFLHVDLNAAELELECLRILWDQIVDFGVILLDDFANAGYPDSARVIGEFLSERKQNVLITPSGQGIVLKIP